MKIYGDKISGNCYKLQLVCSLLNIDYEWIQVDVLSGFTRSEEFLAKNPNAKVPLLELDDGRFLAESNAILNYLAAGSDFIPKDTYALARVQEWQFFEQYSHEPFIAVARFIKTIAGMPKEREEEFYNKQKGGQRALALMDKQLAKSQYLIGETFTVADISLFAYTHVADEGGFSLEGYPNIQRWIKDIQALPGFVAMG